LSDNKILIKAFNNIDTVQGVCENCEEETILVGIVTEFYRCTNCGSDTRQHINGSIRYLQLSEKDKNWLKEKYGEKNL
jgi:uncharacterized protein (DUF983 family)|tara:strand:- start:2980 stop:3213 length:234 start_codon:yes stop_codon:yes gene_type:complete